MRGGEAVVTELKWDFYAGRSGLPSLIVIAPHTGSHCLHRCAMDKEGSSELVTFSAVSQLLNTVS